VTDEWGVSELQEKLYSLNEHLENLEPRNEEIGAQPDTQISQTEPDSRLMKHGTVGSLMDYNVQAAVDTRYKLIAAHEVTNASTDRGSYFQWRD